MVGRAEALLQSASHDRRPMSGHSKWSQIKRQKGVNDAKRGALFTKLTREIITAARQGGGDVDGNYRLRMAVDKARDNSMPMENIKRAIERATGAGADAVQYEEITYEGLGPANVAVIVAAMTDNRNRTAAEIRSIFTKTGGSLTPVAWQFEQRGLLSIPLKGNDPDEVTLAAIDAGAIDVGCARGRRPSGRDRASGPRAGAFVAGRRRLRARHRPRCRWSRPRRSRSPTRRTPGRCWGSSSASRSWRTSRTSTPTSTSPTP